MCAYHAAFPATSPWVTAVGGTQNAERDPDDHGTGPTYEWAANAPDQEFPYGHITTGGGFSDHYAQPAWQKEAVEGYFSTPESKRAKAGYNATGRGIPDVSTNAINFHVFITSFNSEICGTSGSAPSLAGMISVVNARLADKGKGKLGFLNPFLYSKTPVRDVYTGARGLCSPYPLL